MSDLYSRRLSWSVSQNRFSLELAAMRERGIDLLDLSSSNPTASDAQYPHAEIASAFGAIRSFAYEPDAAGALLARQTIAQVYAERGLTVSPDRIFLTASTSEAYGFLFKLLCDPGDEILIPLPSYPLFEYLASLESVRVAPYWLRYDGSWHVAFESLESAVSSRSRAIVVVNPNNPTGSYLKADEVSRLLGFARERGLTVVADEVFSDYSLRDCRNCVPTLVNQTESLTFSLNGLSKLAGMPQLKLGWMVISGPPDQVQEATTRLELILDTYLPVNSMVQQALPRLLQVGNAIRSRIQARSAANLACLNRALEGSSANTLHTEAGWSTIVQVPRTRTEEEWLLHLLRHYQVIVQPGYFFDMPSEAFLVVSLITPEETFQHGVERIHAALSAG